FAPIYWVLVPQGVPETVIVAEEPEGGVGVGVPAPLPQLLSSRGSAVLIRRGIHFDRTLRLRIVLRFPVIPKVIMTQLLVVLRRRFRQLSRCRNRSTPSPG